MVSPLAHIALIQYGIDLTSQGRELQGVLTIMQGIGDELVLKLLRGPPILQFPSPHP
jgi:hypothetical protein